MIYPPNFSHGLVTLGNAAGPLVVSAQSILTFPLNPTTVRRRLYCYGQNFGFSHAFGGNLAVIQFLFSWDGNPTAQYQLILNQNAQPNYVAPSQASVPTSYPGTMNTQSGISIIWKDIITGASPLVLIQPYALVCRADTLTVNLITAFQIYLVKVFVGILSN